MYSLSMCKFQFGCLHSGVVSGNMFLNGVAVNSCNFQSKKRGTVIGVVSASFFVGKALLKILIVYDLVIGGLFP